MDIALQDIILRLSLAYVIGLLIGLERTIFKKPAGIITNSTVAIAACAIAMFQIYLVNDTINLQESKDIILSSDLGRIPAQVITGVGFLGAGAIIVSGKKIKGITTAAIIWVCAVIGLIIGYGYYELGLILSGFILFNMLVLSRIVYRVSGNSTIEDE